MLRQLAPPVSVHLRGVNVDMCRSLLVLVGCLTHRLVVLHETYGDLLFADVADLAELRVATSHAGQDDVSPPGAQSLVRYGDLWHFFDLDVGQIEQLLALSRDL